MAVGLGSDTRVPDEVLTGSAYSHNSSRPRADLKLPYHSTRGDRAGNPPDSGGVPELDALVIDREVYRGLTCAPDHDGAVSGAPNRHSAAATGVALTEVSCEG